MYQHSFSVRAAEKVGIEAAVLLQNISYWCEHNAANGKGFHDGMFWTYNSIAAFVEQFPYMNAGKIRTALKKLEDQGYILVGNYNANKYDRTKWYAVTKEGAELLKEVPEPAFAKTGTSICQNKQMDLQKSENRIAKNDKPIPNIETDIKQDRKTNNRFVPPSVEDVREYATANNFNVDAESFVLFYESKGWMIGKNKMKNWRAAVSGWHRRNGGSARSEQAQRNMNAVKALLKNGVDIRAVG